MNPYNHTSQDTIAHMNLDYWLEQVKATTAIAAHLAVPVPKAPTPSGSIYLPLLIRLIPD